MSKELVVDGKMYLPSTALAGRFSYTTDYLSKLAREGKIDATRVGRQWFLNEDSLRKFIVNTQAAKAKRSESIRQERILERAEHEQKNITAAKPTISTTATSFKNVAVDQVVKTFTPDQLVSPLQVLAQAVAIVFCGLVVGTFGFMAYQDGVHAEDFAQATFAVAGNVSSALAPVEQLALVDFSEIWSWLFGRTVIVGEDPSISSTVAIKDGEQLAQAGQIKEPQIQNAMLMLDSQTSTTTAKEIKESFSDEVAVIFDGPDTGILEPVFKEETDEAYRFLLVPVTQIANE